MSKRNVWMLPFLLLALSPLRAQLISSSVIYALNDQIQALPPSAFTGDSVEIKRSFEKKLVGELVPLVEDPATTLQPVLEEFGDVVGLVEQRIVDPAAKSAILNQINDIFIALSR